MISLTLYVTAKVRVTSILSGRPRRSPLSHYTHEISRNEKYFLLPELGRVDQSDFTRTYAVTYWCEIEHTHENNNNVCCEFAKGEDDCN